MTCARLVPRQLANDQKALGKELSKEREGVTFLYCVVTCDTLWMHYMTSVSK